MWMKSSQRPPPSARAWPCSREAPAANKPKALSAASGDWDIFDVLQSHILPCPTASTSVYVAQPYATERNNWIDHAIGRACHATSRKNGQRHATRRRDSYRQGLETEVPVTSHTEARATFWGAKPIIGCERNPEFRAVFRGPSSDGSSKDGAGRFIAAESGSYCFAPADKE